MEGSGLLVKNRRLVYPWVLLISIPSLSPMLPVTTGNRDLAVIAAQSHTINFPLKLTYTKYIFYPLTHAANTLGPTNHLCSLWSFSIIFNQLKRVQSQHWHCPHSPGAQGTQLRVIADSLQAMTLYFGSPPCTGALVQTGGFRLSLKQPEDEKAEVGFGTKSPRGQQCLIWDFSSFVGGLLQTLLSIVTQQPPCGVHLSTTHPGSCGKGETHGRKINNLGYFPTKNYLLLIQ